MVGGKAWIAHYVYPSQDGNAISAERLVEADSEDEARDRAAKMAPADEFLLTLSPVSDDQFLGTVRQRAAHLSEDEPFDPARYQDTKEK